MSFKVIEGVADDLKTTIAVSRIYVIYCRVQWMTSLTVFLRCTFSNVKQHRNTGQSTETALFDQLVLQPRRRNTLPTFRRPSFLLEC